MEVLKALILYIILINLAGFLLMAIDKKKARRGSFRISEATLFVIAIFGGSIGCIGGMYLFRHKTLKPAFQYGMPAILAIQLLIIIIIFLLLPLDFRVM